MPSFDYTTYADAIAADIAAGHLKAGDRLPPQRAFAYQKAIAVSTAGRVYAELLRRGLVVGEVGRGTFVAGASIHPALPRERHDGPIDLEFNFRPFQSRRTSRPRIGGLQRADVAAS
jgi:DNA-binding transcriptional MocR family regulator